MSATIEAEVVNQERHEPQTQALARVEQAQGGVLDMPVEQFKGGLERRKQNRAALMDWIGSSMVEGIDYGRIHTVGKDKCRDGKNCKVDWHWSKPCLFKPGAERICGMLGMIVDFPTLKDYEQAAIKGVEIKTVILRCEICDAAGRVVGVGMGARTVAKDYGDVNKAIKMAEKSAHIDATLRMAGLSEIFTQDLDDPNGAKEPKNAPGRARGGSTHTQAPKPAPTPMPATPMGQNEEEGGFDSASNTPLSGQAPSPQSAPKSQPGPSLDQKTAQNPQKPENGAKPSAAKLRQRFAQRLLERFGEGELQRLEEYGIKAGILMENETLPDWPEQWLPVDKTQMDAYLARIADFFAGLPAVRAWGEPEPHKPPPEPCKPIEVPRDTKPVQQASDLPPEIGNIIIPVPHKGETKKEYDRHPETIGQLYALRHTDDQARRRLFGFMNHFVAEGWQGRPPKEADIKFRAGLDALAAFLEDTHPEEVSDS